MSKMSAMEMVQAFDRGEMTFANLLAGFKAMPLPAPRRPKNRSWGTVYREAEEGNDNDVPQVLAAGKFAGMLTDAQSEQLMKAFSKR